MIFEKYSKIFSVGVYFLFNICYNIVEKSRKMAGKAMQICKLTIITTVDGRENKLVRMGKINITDEEILLFYKEEQAQVQIELKGKEAKVVRQGDYGLRLRLIPREVTEGYLLLGGSEGKILTRTHSVAYEKAQNGVDIELAYELLFGEEVQNMRLRIAVKTKP